MKRKEPWISHPELWKNEASWWAYIRGCLRATWSRNPVKHELLKSERKQIKNPNPKGKKATVWGCTCKMCGEDHVMKDIQVDHIVEAGSLRSVEDIQGFVERLLFVTKDDLRVVCKECNAALNMANRQGISFEEARAEKAAIRIIKEKRDLIFLENCGIIPARTQKARREQLSQILRQEYEVA